MLCLLQKPKQNFIGVLFLQLLFKYIAIMVTVIRNLFAVTLLGSVQVSGSQVVTIMGRGNIPTILTSNNNGCNGRVNVIATYTS